MRRIAVNSKQQDECCHHDEKPSPWKINPLLLTSLFAGALFGLAYLFPRFAAYRVTFAHYVRIMGFPILLGFLLGGVMDRYIPREYISKGLARKKKRTVLFAVFLGFLMSGCSHGILAISMELHKKGASAPAVIAFLLASPWANVTITILLIGFFGIKAFLIIGSALFIALFTGFLFQILDRKNLIEHNPNTLPVEDDFSIRADISRRLKAYRFSFAGALEDVKRILQGSWRLVQMVLWWVLLGMILASFAGAFIPPHLFQQYLGSSIKGLLLTLAFATVIEVCSEGSSPLAFEIFRQTGAFGNTFVFLMSGVVTDYTEIGLIWVNMGKKTALWLIAITVPQVLLLGWMFNVFF